jgi:Arp2/3 complex, 34 kD subunit p34-Arc
VSIDQVVSDFDGVTFHLSTPESKSRILISISVKCFDELVRYGAQQVLEREYGPLIVAPESGYDFSVVVDLDNLPEEKGQYKCFDVCLSFRYMIGKRSSAKELVHRSTRRFNTPCLTLETKRYGCAL